ncbi:MAG TPA: hypothetical protein DD444_01555, partial [Citreicella sp.]|nr:hypothetical protein [Citreicella sp.]
MTAPPRPKRWCCSCSPASCASCCRRAPDPCRGGATLWPAPPFPCLKRSHPVRFSVTAGTDTDNRGADAENPAFRTSRLARQGQGTGLHLRRHVRRTLLGR